MTYALCFNCGNKKFGALVPCRKCGNPASGDINLDIAFSDNILSVESIESFGDVIKIIRMTSNDLELNFWAFIRYVSLNHPSILDVKLPEVEALACDALLSRLAIPEFKLVRSVASQEFIDGQSRQEKPGA